MAAPSRNTRLRWVFVVQGILDGLESELGVRDRKSRESDSAFELWDAKLGLSEKIRRRSLEDAYEVWSRSLRLSGDVALVVREHLAHPLEPQVDSALIFGVSDRLFRWVASRAGAPIEPASPWPDTWDPKIGEPLTYGTGFATGAGVPLWLAKAQFERLEQSYLTAKRAIRQAESDRARERGRPVEEDIASLRRAGRTYFLLKLKRPPRPRPVDVGREFYDAPASRDHHAVAGGAMYCPCHEAVAADVKRAARVLATLPS